MLIDGMMGLCITHHYNNVDAVSALEADRGTTVYWVLQLPKIIIVKPRKKNNKKKNIK